MTRPAASAWVGAILCVAACTGLAALMQPHFELPNLAMIYLLGVVVAAVAFGRGPALLAALLSVAVFDFGFVPPRFTMHVSHTQYVVTLVVMLVVAMVIGTLTARLREQLESARRRERQTAALHRLSHALAASPSAREVVSAAQARIGELLGEGIAIAVPDASGRLALADGRPDGGEVAPAARWAFESGQIAGLEGQNFGGANALHLPLQAATRVLGVLTVPMPGQPGPVPAERLNLLRALANQTALALERCRLAEEGERTRAEIVAERARGALLRSVSHDLRTPLAAIAGAATSLRAGGALSQRTRDELAESISEEAGRLNRRIGNLLDMTRLESGALRVRKEWHSVEEVVGAALVRLEPVLGDREIRLDIPHDLPLVPLDDVLFEQVVWNLVENAAKYAPADQPIEIAARIAGHELTLEVSDRGPGLEPGEEQLVFEKFRRGSRPSGQPGFGLGLAICRGIVEAHGGRIRATNRPGGGTRFEVVLPLEGEPPTLERENGSGAGAESAP